MKEAVRKEAIIKAAKFANFCQKFKMEAWKTHNFTDHDLDDLALIAWKLLK